MRALRRSLFTLALLPGAASSKVFLHRAIALKKEPARAYAAVSAVWSPHGPWRKLIEEQLRTAGIKFDLL